MFSMIFKLIDFVKTIMKGFKLVKTMLTVVSLVSSFTGSKSTITMKTFNGVDVTITIGNDEVKSIDNVHMIDTKDTKAIEMKDK